MSDLEAPADADLRELIVLGVMAAPPHPQWSPTTDLADLIADELVPLVRAQVEAARQDALNQAADAFPSPMTFYCGTGKQKVDTFVADWLRDRAARD